MGFSSIGPGSLLLILLIIIVLFGSKRLRSLGTDLGAAIRGLRRGLHEKNASEDDRKSE